MDVEANGIRQRYTVELGAAGPTIVLLHGYQLDRSFWQDQVRILADRNRVLVPDLRGFGDSPLGDVAETTPRLLADDLAALLDRVAVREPIVLGGLSMGGYAALSFVVAHPERVRALVLADTRASADSPERRADRLATAERVERERSTASAIEALFPHLMAPAAYADRALVERLRAMAARPSPAAIAAALRGMAARPDLGPALGAIRVPTLIVVGELDGLTPPSEARAMHAAIAGSELIELPGVGHLSNLEASEAFNRALLSFLERHGLRG